MYAVEKLQSGLDALNTKRSQIAGAGWYLQHCWLVQVKPGGNARTDRKYWQVRSRLAMFDGKTLRHLKPDEVEDYRAAIERGRQLKQIDRKIEKLQQQLDKLIATTNTTRDTSPPTPLLQGEGSHTLPTPSREGGLGVIDPSSTESTTAFTDVAEQERLVKELLANSQELRTSLRNSATLSKLLRAGSVNLRNGHPRPH